MKSKKKVLVTVLCAVMLVVGSVLGTMAYLTSQSEVNNTFTVGAVNITLDETAVDDNGVALQGVDRRTANTYKLMPGHYYIKDPIVHVTPGSELSWIFVKVDNGIAAIEDSTTIHDQMLTDSNWAVIDATNNIYAYKDAVAGGENGTDVPVFASFKVKTDADVAAYNGKTIKVTAYAVQKDGFNTAKEAWTATFGAPTTSTGTTE